MRKSVGSYKGGVSSRGKEERGLEVKSKLGNVKRRCNGPYEVNLRLPYYMVSKSYTVDLCAVGFT